MWNHELIGVAKLYVINYLLMLDEIKARRGPRGDIFTPDYTPQQAVTLRKYLNEAGRNLCVLFPPWHGGGRAYEQLIKRLITRNNAVLAYYFHNEILRPNTEHVRNSFTYICDTVVKELTETVATHDYEHVRFIGLSLGVPALAMVSSKFSGFDSVTMVPGASSLARSAWYGIRTQHIRTGIEQLGDSLYDVELAWIDLAPATHIGSLIGKDVSLLLSSTDRIIPSIYQQEYADLATMAGLETNVRTTRLGHYATIGSFCLYGDI
jgi:hypothetical protein